MATSRAALGCSECGPRTGGGSDDSNPHPREDILRELANVRAHAGRMTVKHDGYADCHEAINGLLDELEALLTGEDDDA